MQPLRSHIILIDLDIFADANLWNSIEHLLVYR